MSTTLTLDHLLSRQDIKSLKVLVRADLNVPLTSSGTVRDATRIERLLPSLEQLSEAGARIGVLSHFGRPKGKHEKTMSLGPVSHALADIMGCDIAFSSDCIGDEAKSCMENLADGQIAVLENTRFHLGEESNDEVFCKALASLADAYVNDAFSTAHRAHASTAGIARLLPAYAGRAMQTEIEALTIALEAPIRPLMAVIGGAKVSSKLDLLVNLVEKVDTLVIGGGMANTFMAAQGHEIGRSLCEDTMLNTALEIISKAKKNKCEILLPDDVVLATDFGACDNPVTVAADAVPDEMMILDAGPKTVKKIKVAIDGCKTLVWNGPLGAFELTPFDTATNAASLYAAKRTKNNDLVSIAGGGDTVAALNHSGAGPEFTYVSTAGGAFLEWLEGKALPGVKSLELAAEKNL